MDVITWEEFRAQPSRSAAVLLQVGEATVLGPFARIELSWHVRTERAPEEGPSGWASGEEFLLLRTEDGREVVGVGRWVT